MEGELSPQLVYHGIAHTREEVVPAVETLAAMEVVKGIYVNLLRTADWFHDLRYVEHAVHHELISGRIAADVLPSFVFDKDKIEFVR